jgi:hypothetical protein
MGYLATNYPATMSPTDSLFQQKDAAYRAYAPFDGTVCPSYSSCAADHRDEAQWLLRQYVVTPAIASYSSPGTPTYSDWSNDIALQASVSASSSASGEGPEKAIDGQLGGVSFMAARHGCQSNQCDHRISTFRWKRHRVE